MFSDTCHASRRALAVLARSFGRDEGLALEPEYEVARTTEHFADAMTQED